MNATHFIPDGWRRVSLAELAEIQTGLAKGKKTTTSTLELPYLRVANVQDGYLDLGEVKLISVARHEIDRYSLRPGDVLLTEGGDADKLGRGFVWEGQIEECLHQNHVFSVRVNRKYLDPYFLSYQAASHYGKAYFLNCSKQSTNLASINSSQLREFPVLLPDLQEQARIVNTVRLWERAEKLHGAYLRFRSEFRQGFLRKLLTSKKRLNRFEDTWREFHLSDFLMESRQAGSDGATAKKLTLKLYGRGVHEKDDRRAGSENTKYYVRRAGQFIYSKLDFLNGAFGIIPEHLDGYETTLDLPCFDVAEGLDARFLLLLVSREEFYSRFLGSAAGGRKARRVNPAEFLATRIHIPGIEEQRAIVDAVATLDREIDLLERQLAALKRQKQALMQQLLTGRIRVGEARVPDQKKSRRAVSV